MKNKALAVFICLLAICILVVGTVPVSAESESNTVGKVQSLAHSIVDFKLKQSGVNTIQNWINSSITQNAGTASEWYVFALSQNGSYDFSSYKKALIKYLDNNTVYSAVSKQKYALTLIATGSTDSYISTVMEESIGQQGIMSWVYGLHLLNNGYISSSVTVKTVKEKLLSLQLNDGGWALMGTTGDVDITAMTIQSLAPYYKSDSSVKSAVDKALSLLSSRQLQDGDYSSYGVSNAESTAQVITALSELGINGEADSRFIKNGNTLFDGLEKYRLSDGSFCHRIGEGSNDTATVQAFYSLISYIRMSDGKSGLYILDNRNPKGVATVTPSASNPVESATKKSTATDNESDSSDSSQTTQGNKISNTEDLDQTDKSENNGGSLQTDISQNYVGTEQANNSQNDDSLEQPQSLENSTDYQQIQSTENSVNAQQTQLDTSATAVTKSIDAKADKEKDAVETNTEIISENSRNNSNYKLWTCLIIVGLGGTACVVLFVMKKMNKKNFIAVLVIVIIAVCVVLVTNFQSAEDYYNGKDTVKENATGTVTLTIRCDTVVGKSDSEYIPTNGIILDTTEFEIENNDTVYEILTEASKRYNIHMENSGTEGMVYMSGINYLYELDFGELSGWMYYVNGDTPSVGCDQYILSDGDSIEWLYTCEMGNDLK